MIVIWSLFCLSIGSFQNNIISYFETGRFDLFKSSCKCSKRKLKVLENIPILSYIFLNGKCFECSDKIGKRYLLNEFLILVFGLILFYKVQEINTELVITFLEITVLISIAQIDFKHFIIPNKLLTVLFLLNIAGIFIFLPFNLINVLSGLTISIILFLSNSIAEYFKGITIIGMGDIKFIFVFSIFFVFPLNIISLWLASIIGLLFVGAHRLYNSTAFNLNKVPFGTFLSVSFIILILLKDEFQKLTNTILEF